jgi:AbrB family looped-hinge helix DNA binding protein
MDTIMVSPNFEVTLPQRVRESLGIHAGQKVQVIQYDNRVELIPLRSIDQARGILRGIDTSIAREPDRE